MMPPTLRRLESDILHIRTPSTVGEQAQVCFCLSVSFDGLKIAVGVLMSSDKSVSHKIFVSFVI